MAKVFITGNIVNATCNYEDGEVIVINKDIIITANSGYTFKGSYEYLYGGYETMFFINNGTYLIASTKNIDEDIYLEDDYIATKEVKQPKVFITGNIVNATCNYEDGEEVNINKDIIITANEGYTFKGQYSYFNGLETMFFTNKGTYLIATINEYPDGDIELDDNYVATREVEQLGSFVNLYKTNQAELSELSKVRFYKSEGQVIDYGQFINSLYILPFDIPSDILGDKSTILLGNMDSKVESTLISNYMFDFDAGEIEVPLKYNNIYDFVNTECILHLPFLDKVYLNTEYVIGQKLTITFTIELYSGTLTANIKSSFNNEIVASVQGIVGMNIPFIQKSNDNVINSISNVYKNRNNRCFVEVNRNIPYTKDNNVFGGSVIEYGRIGDYTGYLECDKIVLETSATNQEQEEIKNLLRNGVFI